MQKISSIYKFILGLQHIIESQKLKDHANFMTTSTQKSEFVPAFKKIDLFHRFIIKIQLILEFCKSGHSDFRPSLPNAFSINF